MENGLRLCEVNGEVGHFHKWSEVSKPLSWGDSMSNLSYTVGIVEFKEGVKKVEPEQIRFIDEINDNLEIMKCILRPEMFIPVIDKCVKEMILYKAMKSGRDWDGDIIKLGGVVYYVDISTHTVKAYAGD